MGLIRSSSHNSIDLIIVELNDKNIIEQTIVILIQSIYNTNMIK